MLHAICSGLIGAAILGAAPGAPAPARPTGSVEAPKSPRELRRQAYTSLLRPLSLDVTDARLEDVLAYIETVSGARLDPKWQEGGAGGLEKDAKVTIRLGNVTTLAALERILATGAGPSPDGATWQLTDEGLIEVGPRSRLNASAFLKIYDVRDLLYEIPNFADAPELDLDSVLNQRQGGGSGSIFTQTDQGDGERRTPQERARALVDVIITTVEPDQWRDNGGDGASVREQNGVLLITAPDYIHRQVGGYDF